MTVQETFDHITKHMTAEQALMKLLEGNIRSYEYLKFRDNEAVHPLLIVSMAALEMGWDIAVPDNKGDENMELIGMAIGTPEYFEELFAGDDSCGECSGNCSCTCDNPDEELNR